MSGRIIFLNGTSSSGKTTIAQALQSHLESPHMLLSLDQFFHFYPDKFLDSSTADSLVLEALATSTIRGFHRCILALSEAGNSLIIDHVLQDESWLQDCVVRLKGLPVLFVGVRCPLPVAEAREMSRPDRERGTARSQFAAVHLYATYDLELDTSVLDVTNCVQMIVEALGREEGWTSFPKLAIKYAIG